MYDISAKIIAKSRNPAGVILTSFEIVFPTSILAEINTHRVASKSTSSTRAIPTKTLLQQIEQQPFTPKVWQKNQKGMVGVDDLNTKVEDKFATFWSKLRSGKNPFAKSYLSKEEAWHQAAKQAAIWMRAFDEAGYHKQIQGRLGSAFMYSRQIFTTTMLTNFFFLRRAEDAEPHMRILANRMYNAYMSSKSTELQAMEWHLPYITDEDRAIVDDVTDLAMVSAARCARVSYRMHDGKPTTYEADIKLAKWLLESRHASPFEHQAIAMDNNRFDRKTTGNFHGFAQFRKFIESNNPSFTPMEDISDAT